MSPRESIPVIGILPGTMLTTTMWNLASNLIIAVAGVFIVRAEGRTCRCCQEQDGVPSQRHRWQRHWK